MRGTTPPPQSPRVACPACNGVLRPPAGLLPGKSIRCPHCTAVFPLAAEPKVNGVAPAPPQRSIRLMNGGPVEEGRGFVLHSGEWRAEGSVEVAQDYALTASLDILKAIAEGGGPRHGLLALGYAGWGAGQLEQEITRNDWLHVAPDEDLIFGGEDETRWRRALAKLRVDPLLVSPVAGRA